jgi:hypothetical protein
LALQEKLAATSASFPQVLTATLPLRFFCQFWAFPLPELRLYSKHTMEPLLENLNTLQVTLKSIPAGPDSLSDAQWQQLCDAHVLCLQNQVILLEKLLERPLSHTEALQTMRSSALQLLHSADQIRARRFRHAPDGDLSGRLSGRISKKRTRHAPSNRNAQSFSFVDNPSKRKGVEGEVFAVLPNNKRYRASSRAHSEPPADAQSPPRDPPVVEYDDISEEVESRLRKRREARLRDKTRLASGTMRKRARKSFETAQESDVARDESTPPRAPKKVKENHSASADEVDNGISDILDAQPQSVPAPGEQGTEQNAAEPPTLEPDASDNESEL